MSDLLFSLLIFMFLKDSYIRFNLVLGSLANILIYTFDNSLYKMTTRVRSYVMFCRYMFGEEGYCLTSIHTAVNYLVSEGLNKCGT